jgi:hypothetical protein
MNFWNPSTKPYKIGGHWMILAAWIAVTGLTACASAPPLPDVDLLDPKWTVWKGQAVWKQRADRPALAGDLIAARHSNGDLFVSFTKSAFPIFTARTAGPYWRIDFVERERFYTGKGGPPERFVWFRLPDLLMGDASPRDWEVEAYGSGEWSMVNHRTGESIRVVLDR